MNGGIIMKKSRRLFIMFLVTMFMLSITIQPTFAATHTGLQYDLYVNEASETVNIGGTTYTYYYYYENGDRAINIVNHESGYTDKIVYDETESKIYLNGNQFAVINYTVCTPALAYTDGWESLGACSYYISWGTATTAAVVAGMIAIYLGSLGPRGVIAAMGIGALGIIAANSSGGTLSADLQWYHVPLMTPQYRYIWTFEASTGDTYGPYISLVTL